MSDDSLQEDGMADRIHAQDSLEILDSTNQQQEDDDSDDGLPTMSVLEHLEELRWRLLKVLIAVSIGSIIAFTFRNGLITFLEGPLLDANITSMPGMHPLVVMTLMEGFTTDLLISIVAGTVLALPILLYQTWAFIAPGLYEHEKRAAIPFVFIGIILFLVGISLGYIILRYPVQWLASFTAGTFSPMLGASSYFLFVAVFIFIFGLIFELPLVLTFLTKAGVVSKGSLQKKRAVAHFGMWVASTFATPGADIYSPIIVSAAMSLLYELTILFIHIFVKQETTEECATLIPPT
jgi:sec-independent protein translocase protein TatC